MKVNLKSTPREFTTGKQQSIIIKDMASICLQPDEQVTFVTNENAEYDVCRKAWGFYATPSINSRLRQFGFKTALVKNLQGRIYIMIIEESKLNSFYEYIKSEDLVILEWLDETSVPQTTSCPICYFDKVRIVKKYSAPPVGENEFHFNPYTRVLHQCISCHHCFNTHIYNFTNLYDGQYATTVYKYNMRERFKQIINLPEDKSDNYHRVNRVVNLVHQVHNKSPVNFHVLDIGSGLAVFPYRLKQITGWRCVALDPDPRQAEHAQECCGLETINANVMNYQSEEKFNLITLNKVLEHVEDPAEMLQKIKNYLAGFLYIEVPDGEAALKDSPDREEFFIEHFHAFSLRSIQILLNRLDFNLISLNRIKEPSGKYTIYCFAEFNT